MSDVLTAAQVKNLADTIRLYIPPDAFGAFNVVAEDAIASLARSHEQLRGRLRESEIAVYDVLAQIEQLRGERDELVNECVAWSEKACVDRDALKAAVRAGGEAAAALRETTAFMEHHFYGGVDELRDPFVVLAAAREALALLSPLDEQGSRDR